MPYAIRKQRHERYGYDENDVTRYVYDGRGAVAQAISAPVAGAAATSALPDISVKVQSFDKVR